MTDINGIEDVLTRQNLTLRPATLQDKRNVYNWLANSNLTGEMLGPPTFSDNPIPTWDEFDKDYLDYFFDGSQPLKGQCFILINNEQEVGQINYNEIDSNSRSTEIDIWLADRKYIGKSLGTEAIKILCDYVSRVLKCETIYIAPSRRNLNAIRAYQKAGFMEIEKPSVNYTPDYYDTVVMIKRIKK